MWKTTIGATANKYHYTECPKIYRKSVLHLLKYKFPIYLSRCRFVETQYELVITIKGP